MNYGGAAAPPYRMNMTLSRKAHPIVNPAALLAAEPRDCPPRRAVLAVFLGVTLALFSGCVALEAGADPVVVRAEQATAAALETFDTFLVIEHANRALYRAAFPEAHEFAERLRTEAPKWLATARTMTKAYKLNRTPENKANLATAVAFLEAGLRQAQDYLIEAERKKGRP